MRFRNSWLSLIFSLITLSLVYDKGCQQSDEYALPAGTVEAGKSNFVELGCNLCHSVGEIPWAGEQSGHPHLPLGGETTKVKNYGDLVTSIINPSHKINREYIIQMRRIVDNSPMTNYNEVMTIQELINLVTFLHGEYELVVPELSYDLPEF
ncbi:MAG: cytochrome C [Saprospiraceae bacterium]|nr:cytochrome C [Saprospiraceae bacterium]